MPTPHHGSPPGNGDPEAGRDWRDDEAPLGREVPGTIRRLFRRGSISWVKIVCAALIVTAGMTIYRARMRPNYEATVVLRVSEGELQTELPSAGSALGTGALRAHIEEIVFTRTQLLALMERRPDLFPPAAKDPASAVEDLRKQIEISIAANDFVEDRSPNEPPRSARIAISFRSPKPEVALASAHELADLFVGGTQARQQELLRRQRAAAEAVLRRAGTEAEQIREATPQVPGGPDPRLEAARARLQSAGAKAASAQLRLRAASEEQGLRFEIVDPGRLPAPPTRSALWAGSLSTLLIVLLTAWLLAGAFDPRVLDGADLAEVGVVTLGRLPALPGLASADVVNEKGKARPQDGKDGKDGKDGQQKGQKDGEKGEKEGGDNDGE